MLRNAIAMLALIGLTSCETPSNAPIIQRVELVDYGLYDAEIIGDSYVDTVDLSYQETKIEDHVIQTRRIPYDTELHFGFRVNIHGEGDGDFPLTRRVIHLPSKTGTTIEHYTESATVNRGYTITFDFDENTRNSYHSIEEEWILQMLNGEDVLHEETFIVY